MKINTIIVDDEPHAREGLKIRLKDYKEITIVAECSSGFEAVEKINELYPELVFLDIQMPGMNGFEVLKNLNHENIPIIIFVTAYDRYALKAFEFHAVDYLLKPIDKNRLKKSINFAISEIENRRLKLYSEKLKALADEYLNLVSNKGKNIEDNKYLNRISVKNKNIIKIIPVSEIDWIEAQGDYVYLHVKDEKFLLRDSLSSLENKLNPYVFIRIHRSSVVNIERVEKLKSNEHGDYELFLKDGTKLKMSRTYKENFQRLSGNTF